MYKMIALLWQKGSFGQPFIVQPVGVVQLPEASHVNVWEAEPS